MSGKSFFIDLSKCIACRGCQIACKQWKKLPAEPTHNAGSLQNPPDLSAVTLKVVRMKEEGEGDALRLFALPDQCRHCIDPSCKAAADNIVKGAIIQDKDTGAVIYTETTKRLPAKNIRAACPYDIPRVDEKTKLLHKCDMCIDRVQGGLLPACVKTCPSGAMSFGDRDEMLKLGQARLEKLKAAHPKAVLVDYDQVRTAFLAEDDPRLYAKNLMSDATEPKLYTRFAALDTFLAPLRQMSV